MRRKRKSSIRRTLIGMVIIIVSVVVCSVGTVAAIDWRCSADINKWLPIYPDAELVETIESGFFRDRASGITVQVYHSPDSATIVRRWYSEYRRELTSGQYNVANPNAALTGISSTNRRITEDPDTGGSFITLQSECAYN